MHAAADSAAAPLELAISRLIDASPDLVFLAWTSQEHAAQWWGPQGFTTVSCQLDARPGGSYRVAMRAPDGTVHTKRGTYHDVVPSERLSFSYAWEGEDGEPGHAMFVTVTFQPQGGKTLLTLRQTGFESIAARDSHRSGWTSCIERFAHFVALLSADAPPERHP